MLFDLIFVVIFLGLEVMYYLSFRKFEVGVFDRLDALALEVRQLHQDPDYVKDLFKEAR